MKCICKWPFACADATAENSRQQSAINAIGFIENLLLKGRYSFAIGEFSSEYSGIYVWKQSIKFKISFFCVRLQSVYKMERENSCNQLIPPMDRSPRYRQSRKMPGQRV